MKYAFFDTKPYDRPAFDEYGEAAGVKFKYYEAKLDIDTVNLARGCDGVCIFVNDTADAAVIKIMGEKRRCASFLSSPVAQRCPFYWRYRAQSCRRLELVMPTSSPSPCIFWGS